MGHLVSSGGALPPRAAPRTSVHLDEALASVVTSTGSAIEVSTLTTSTADFPFLQFMRDPADPFILLVVDKAALSIPAQAHDI